MLSPVARRPLVAVVVTGVFLILVIAMWPRRATLSGRPEAGGMQQPPAPSQPMTAPANLYRLAAVPLPKGAKVRLETLATSNLAGQVSAGDRVVKVSIAGKSDETWEYEVVEADGAGPLKIRMTCVSAGDTFGARGGGQSFPDERTPGPLQGRTVVAEKVDGRWRTRLEGEPTPVPTPEQQRELDKLFFGTDDPYPAGEVPVGHVWEVEGPALRTLIGERDATSLSGRVKLKFERVTSHAGEPCAEVSLIGDVTGTGTNKQGDQFTFRMGVRGTVLRSLKDRVDLDVQLSGTMDASGQGVRETTTWYWARKGQAVEVKFAGPFKQSRTQKLTLPPRE